MYPYGPCLCSREHESSNKYMAERTWSAARTVWINKDVWLLQQVSSHTHSLLLHETTVCTVCKYILQFNCTRHRTAFIPPPLAPFGDHPSQGKVVMRLMAWYAIDEAFHFTSNPYHLPSRACIFKTKRIQSFARVSEILRLFYWHFRSAAEFTSRNTSGSVN